MKEDSERRWVTAEEFHKAPSDDVVVQKFGVGLVKAADDDAESRSVRFVISDGGVDRENDTISVGGWELDNFKSSPTVLWAHSRHELPVAKATNVTLNGDRLEATAEFADHAFANDVLRLIRGGFLRASSVGFRPLEWVENEERGGIDFKRQELVEFSVVPVPANPRALVAAQKAGIDTEIIRAWIAETLAAWPGELKLPGTAWQKVLDGMKEEEPEPKLVENDVLVELKRLRDDIKGLVPAVTKALAPEQPPEDLVGKTENDQKKQDDGFLLRIFEDEQPESDDVVSVDSDELLGALSGALKAAITEGLKAKTSEALDYLRGRVV